MKASELASANYFKGLIYGDAGAGKTCLAADFPGPIEYWDFDNKFSSAVRYLRNTGKADKLDQIEVFQFAKLPTQELIPAWEQRSRILDDKIAKGQPLGIKTLVIDSLTMFSHYIMEDYVFRSQKAIKRVGSNYSQQDYGLFASHMTRILTGLLGRLDANLVVLGHIDEYKDENTGIIKRQPLVTGQKIQPLLPAWFEEVYVARVMSDGKRVLQTQPAEGFVARGQRGLDKFVPMSAEVLLK